MMQALCETSSSRRGPVLLSRYPLCGLARLCNMISIFKIFLIGAFIASPLAVSAQPAPPLFEPLRFFEGRTEGEGRVKVAFKSPYGVRVHGRGKIEADGVLSLHQIVEEEGKPRRERSWRIRETAPGRYAGTLSDATGPVKLEVVDNRFHIKFRMKGGLGVEQWLTAAPGGGSVHNSMVIRKFGIRVATLEETIRKTANSGP